MLVVGGRRYEENLAQYRDGEIPLKPISWIQDDEGNRDATSTATYDSAEEIGTGSESMCSFTVSGLVADDIVNVTDKVEWKAKALRNIKEGQRVL